MNGNDESASLARVELFAQRFYARYAEAVDSADEKALRSLLAADVELTRAGRTDRGIEAFLDVYRTHWAQGIGLCQHQVTNVSVERDLDGVRATAYFRALFFEEARTRLIVGRYVDDLVESGDEPHAGLVVTHKRNVVQRIVTLPTADVIE